MTTLAIKTRHLTKICGNFTVGDRSDPNVVAGPVESLLDPSGTGKTTVVRMLVDVRFARIDAPERCPSSVPASHATEDLPAAVGDKGITDDEIALCGAARPGTAPSRP